MLRLKTESLRRPPEEVCRFLAMDLVAETLQAARRMSRDDDPEALHDFRVGLRRLRSLARAYRVYLKDSISGKLASRLKKAARLTSKARDAEVHLAWIRSKSSRVRKGEWAGVRWVSERLEPRSGGAAAGGVKDWAKSFKRLAEVLQKRLSSYRVRVRRGRPAPTLEFKTAAASLLLEHCRDLRGRVAAISRGHREALHDARISAKRLRYLLEPLVCLLEGGEGVLERMRALQDLLGEINDLQALEPILRADRAAAKKELPAAVPGICRLLRLTSIERVSLRRRISTRWLHGKAEALLEAIERHAEVLSHS